MSSNNAHANSGETHIYTDGSCLGNPGPGGWAAIVLPPMGQRLVCLGKSKRTTNNRMEMQAIIAGLEKAGPANNVVVYSDSRYVVDAFNKGWLKKWTRNGWRSQNGPVKNRNLWERLLQLSAGNGRRRFSIRWVRAHASNRLNNEADLLARQQAAMA